MARKSTGEPMAIRGLMLDSARLMERHEFYFDLLPQLAAWGFNTLWWHFVDDQGFGVKLDSHPELASPHAFSKREVRKFVAAAEAAGIDVVPEVETLGHAGYIINLPQYAHLADGERTHFNAACPSHPQTLELMGDILTEVAELFPSPYLHAGLDEVSFAGCPRCAKRGRGKPAWWIYAEHVKAIHEVITGLGKRMVMWADHVEDAPAMLKRLPKDIVMGHWQYGAAGSGMGRCVDVAAIERSLDAGFECVGAPSMAWFGTMVHPRACDIDVMDVMAEAASRLRGRGMLGMVNTWWVPGRVLRDACLPAVAYTGAILNAGGGVDRAAYGRRFLRSFFGLTDAKAARALWDMTDFALHMDEAGALTLETTADRFDALKIADADGYAARLAAAERAAEHLLAARPKVTAHREAYDAITLAALTTATLLNNARRMSEVYRACRDAQRARNGGRSAVDVAAALAPAVEALKHIEASMKEITALVAQEWDRTRHRRDVKKHLADATVAPCGRDMLLGRLARGKTAVQALRRGFVKGVAAARRGGPIPAWG